MTTNSAQQQSDDEIPRWAAVADQRRLRTRRWATRLFCSPRKANKDGGAGTGVVAASARGPPFGAVHFPGQALAFLPRQPESDRR